MSKKVILCVDDEKIVLNSLKTQLREKFGSEYSYETAESADDASEIIEELVEESTDILIIVSDWLMPGVKGDEFLINIHKKHPNIVKIMLTGQADDDAIKRAYEQANLYKCLHKPWVESELFETIKTGLDSVK